MDGGILIAVNLIMLAVQLATAALLFRIYRKLKRR